MPENVIRSLGVFSGSAEGRRPIYREHAAELGRLLASRKIRVIYGGGSAGLMGVLAGATMEAGGTVVGVIPQRIQEMIPPIQLTELIVVDSMHVRKARMYELSDAFVAMPGGIGTVEEFFEVYTWQQLGYHLKPLGLLNSGGFFDPLLKTLDHLVEEGFFRSTHRQSLLVANDPTNLLDAMLAHRVHYVPKYG